MRFLRVAARVVAATLGAYVVAAGAAALIGVALASAADMSRSDALIAGSCLAYMLFAGMMLWCFAERRLRRVWGVTLAAAVATHVAAYLIAPSVPLSGGAA